MPGIPTYLSTCISRTTLAKPWQISSSMDQIKIALQWHVDHETVLALETNLLLAAPALLEAGNPWYFTKSATDSDDASTNRWN
jgi:hypothetical protein